MCLNANKIKKNGSYKETSYKGKEGDTYNIETWGKCGSCAECMAGKANDWLVRNYYEEKAHEKKCFITLTYAKNPRILIKKDLQDFIKRLRKYLEKSKIKIRYFGCGEYGTLNYRPHFHLIIYGWEDKKPIYSHINKKGNIVYESKIIAKMWTKTGDGQLPKAPIGKTSYQTFNSKEIPYIALYNSPNDIGRKKMFAKKYDIIEKYKKSKDAQKKLIERLKKIKGEYAEVKEFNVWSQGIGWQEFSKQINTTELTWEEYIEDGIYLTPSPWVKQLANYGLKSAIDEMHKRKTFEIDREETETQRTLQKQSKSRQNHSKEVLLWQKDKDKTIM